MMAMVAVFSTAPPLCLIFPSCRDSRKFHDCDDSRRRRERLREQAGDSSAAGTSNWVGCVCEWDSYAHDRDIIRDEFMTECAPREQGCDVVVKEDNSRSPFVTTRAGTNTTSHRDVISASRRWDVCRVSRKDGKLICRRGYPPTMLNSSFAKLAEYRAVRIQRRKFRWITEKLDKQFVRAMDV